ERVGGLGEGAGLDHPDESGHRSDAVHGRPPKREETIRPHRLQRPWKSRTGRGLPAFRASTADFRPRRTSSVSNSGIATSNIASSAAATPPTAPARRRALWGAE